MSEETVDLDYKKEYYKLQDQMKQELAKQREYFTNELDGERSTKNAFIESQLEEIEFLKNIIKGILHF